ncbi:TonB-dependent receptor [candidate division KSB1 bacterium]|nr:TonB-dependent receptor [candidate division KSB1 bacterium]MBL7092389.1 TonB-dependent receptor [candidate division KSB1 bacterium]
MIKGRVFDEVTQQPIPNVNIFINDSDWGTTTGLDGRFSLTNVLEGKHVLIIQHVAYSEKRIQLNLPQKNAREIKIHLKLSAISFNKIVFTASRRIENVFKSHHDILITTGEDIAGRASSNTADALKEQPGVLVQKTTAGHGSPIIRGLIGKNVLLLYNGIRLNKPTFRFGANQYMNTINAENLDRIEVTKGPGSVMYGSDAIGGIVNMISAPFLIDGLRPGIQSKWSARYGSPDQSKILFFSLGHKARKFFIFSNFGIKNIGDLKAGKNIGLQNPTGYKEWNGNFKFGYQLNQQTSLNFDFLTVQQDEVPRYDKYVTGQYETYLYTPQNRYLSAITIRSQPQYLKWISSYLWNFSYQFEEEGTIERKSGSNSEIRNQNDLTTWGSYLQMNTALNTSQILTYGYEFYFDQIKSSRSRIENGVSEAQRGNFPDGSTYQSLGIFMNDNFIITSATDITLGLRWSQVNLFSPLELPFGNFKDAYRDLTGTVGISYKPKLWLNLIATYAKGFRAPNFNDAVVLKVSNAGVDAPSPGLKPEKSHNFELGAKFHHNKFDGTMFLYYNQLQDLIDRYQGSYNGLNFYDENKNGIRDNDEACIYQKRNAANAFIAGCELTGNLRLSPTWYLSGFIFWTYGQNRTFDEPMSRIPPLMGKISLKYLPIPKLWFELFIRSATKQNRLSSRDIDDSRIPDGGTPGWTTLNFRNFWELSGHLQFNFIFENIFDEAYKEHGSGIFSSGRGFVIGIQYQK